MYAHDPENGQSFNHDTLSAKKHLVKSIYQKIQRHIDENYLFS